MDMLPDVTVIAPDVAVLTLAGEPDDRIIRAALDSGERETAYATLVFANVKTHICPVSITIASRKYMAQANNAAVGRAEPIIRYKTTPSRITPIAAAIHSRIVNQTIGTAPAIFAIVAAISPFTSSD